MNLRDLSYLVALAEHRHFGRAAEAEFVSQPTLSTQIRKLERELGVDLVERHPRQVILTAAGAQVVEHARAALAEVDALRGVAQRARDPESGSLRLGVFPTVAPYLLPHIVPVLHKRYPHLELLLTEEKTEVVVDRLNAGLLDAALLAAPAPNIFESHPLATETFVLAAPHDHPLAGAAGPIDVAELRHHDVLLLDEGHCLRDQALAVCQLVGAHERRGFRASSLETLRQMVAAGVGVTLLPRLAVTPPVAVPTGLRLVEFEEPRPHRDLVMVWRPSSPTCQLNSEIARLVAATTTAVLAAEHSPLQNAAPSA